MASEATDPSAAIKEFRTLLTLRYTAESIEEVNVFLARSLEIRLRLQSRSAVDRAAAYAGGVLFALTTLFSISEQYLAPLIVVALVLGFMCVRAILALCAINEQRQELTVDQKTIREYLFKATRDRKENRVSVAIQNRKSAARLLESENLDDDERRFLQNNVIWWGRRIQGDQQELQGAKESEVWKENDAVREEILSWIDAEFDARPTTELLADY